MRRVLLCFLAVTLGVTTSVRADETIRTVQTRLKTGGFYFGEITGRYDSDTAAAVTRYQIRNGLKITGKLDPQTTYALGVTETKPKMPAPQFGEDVWRYLKRSDQEQLKRMIAEDARSNPPEKSATVKTTKPTPARPPGTTAPAATTETSSSAINRERLRDYIAAFVLAGLDPQVGAETEFFADSVNYFGKPGVNRTTIRRDLERYNARWPERSFSLAGDLEINSVNNNLKVSFPLRYELRNGSRHSAGKVLKTLVLEKTGADDLQIISVSERKTK
jgi:peptidoglycan hydrolase-like protein with peptidoglycan-binding domain